MTFTLILVGFILLVGTVIETIPAIVVLAPTLIKVSVAAGFHEIQAALVLVVGFILGAVTPPVGIVYFTAAFIAEEPLEKVGWALIPFMLVEVAGDELRFEARSRTGHVVDSGTVRRAVENGTRGAL